MSRDPIDRDDRFSDSTVTQAVDRERRRIRRAQAYDIKALREVYKSLPYGGERRAVLTCMTSLDASTRRRKR